MLLAPALARLSADLQATDDRAEMRNALALALRDSTVQLLFKDRDSGAWHDTRGRPVDPLSDLAPDRSTLALGADGQYRDVVLVHDVALLDDRELLDAVSAIVLAGWRREQLTAGLRQATVDL